MTQVRRCDACGAIGDEPYEGWLKVETFERVDDNDRERSAFRLLTPTKPVLAFEVCSHACLPTLAFERSDAFAGVTL